MKRISIYTRDTDIASSSYYRIWQYFNQMNDQYMIYNRSFIPKKLTQMQYNHSVNSGRFSVAVKMLYHCFVYINSIYFFIIDYFVRPETIIVLRSITPKTFIWPANILYSKLLSRTNTVIWDFDDDIFNNNEISEKERRLLEEKTTCIVVTHEHLKSLLSEKSQKKVVLLPTTEGDFNNLNIDELINSRKSNYYDEIRMVWLASSSGIPDILSVSNELEMAAKQLYEQHNKLLKLVVICNKDPEIKSQYLKMEFHCWTRAIARKELLKAHFGIMPLINNEFAKGKGGFKLIQYMAAGLPQIGSAVGFNCDVIQDSISGYLVNDETEKYKWIDYIVMLSTDIKKWDRISRAAYCRWKQMFSYEDNYNFWRNNV